MGQTRAAHSGPGRFEPGGPAVGRGVPVIPERRKSVAPGLLMTVAVIMAGARIGVLNWQPDRPTQLVDVVDTVRGHTAWLVPAAAVMAGLAAVGWLVRFARHRHDADRQRVIAAAASALRTPPASVVLRDARWDHGSLRRGRLHYPRGAVLGDCSEPLTAALAPFAAGQLRARWERRADHFVLDLMPPRPPRVEESSDEVRRVFVPLDHMLTGLCIDQARTRLTKDGQLEQIVATYSTTTRDIGDGFRQRVQTVLDAKAPSPTGYWSLEWQPSKSQVTIKPSTPLPSSAPYPTSSTPEEHLRVPVGLAEGGVTQHWDALGAPHMLVIGPTGTGKTIFINSVLGGCLSRGWRVFLADPKELSFRAFETGTLAGLDLPAWPGVDTVATTDHGMELVIGEVYEEMRRRYAAVKTFEVAERDLQPVLLVIDEAGELVERLNAYHVGEDKFRDLRREAAARGEDPDHVVKPKGTKNPVLGLIWSLLRLGRQCRVYVLIATQRPDVTFIPGEARSNLNTRVGLGRLDGYALEMLFGTRAVQQRVHEIRVDPQTGERTRRRVAGRATVDLGAGPITLQGFWVPDPAKAITGELTQTDRAAVRDLHAFVAENHFRWPGVQLDESAVAVAVGSDAWLSSGQGQCLAEEQVPVPLSVVGAPVDVVDEVLAPIYEEIDLSGYEQRPARALTAGQVVLLEVECHPTPVRLVEVTSDPFGGDDELQVDYEICDPDPRSGQPGVTTLTGHELVPVIND